MDENEVHCARCGSADTVVQPDADTVKHGRCLRCEKDFQATPCPICGSQPTGPPPSVSSAMRHHSCGLLNLANSPS
ncbi:hypothetical protein ACFYXH_12380 [Streptomyces sp. NPDC002730]|uniref:hypothetical protein n=1 Tax=Streptomyces sp. NPDC002730 TaxID=3364662 RepID=UPI00368F6D21